jgi:nucleoside-diphosphate-sugar epimerase
MTNGARVLVTGASGFVGAHCVRYLAERQWRVRALDVHAAPTEFANLDVDFRIADLRDATAVANALVGVEIVFHLASVHLDVAASDADFESVNVTAVARLVEACAAAGVRRLVHVSSVGVYGHVEQVPAAENAPLAPVNTYEKTKCAGEKAAQDAAKRCHLDLVIVRPSWVYGPGCPRTDKLVRALEKGRFFYIGAGANLRHPVYIEDFLAGLVLAATGGPEVAGRVFNVAGPRWMTVEQMVETFARALEVPPPRLRIPRWLGLSAGWAAELAGALLRINPPISRRTLAFFENDNAFDISAARAALQYEPHTELLDGVRRTLAARRERAVGLPVHRAPQAQR